MANIHNNVHSFFSTRLKAVLHCLIINYDILSDCRDVSHFCCRFDSENKKKKELWKPRNQTEPI